MTVAEDAACCGASRRASSTLFHATHLVNRGLLAECAAVAARRYADNGSKVHAQCFDGADTASLGDLIDIELRGFQQFPSARDALANKPPVRTLPCCLAEMPEEGALALTPPLRHGRDGVGSVEVRAQPIEKMTVSPQGVRGDGPWDELGLAAFAMGRHDQSARDRVGDLRAEIATYQVKARVESGGAPCGRENLPFIDVKHVGLRPLDAIAKYALSTFPIKLPLDGRAGVSR